MHIVEAFQTDLPGTERFIRDNCSTIVHHMNPGCIGMITSILCDVDKHSSEILTMIRDENNSISVHNDDQVELGTILDVNILIAECQIDEWACEYIKEMVYELKKKVYSQPVMVRLYKLFYLYHERVGDFTRAYHALKDYISLSKTVFKPSEHPINYSELYNKLGYFALKSDDIYFFRDITDNLSGKIMDACMAYINFDMSYIRKNCKEFGEEKALLIELGNYCDNSKVIRIAEIEKHLGVDRKTAMRLIFKSFGKGLMHGYLDGESGLLHLNGVCGRVVKDNDLREMKDKFFNWRMKINEVIQTIT